MVPTSEKDNNVPLKLKNKWKFKDPILDGEGNPTGEVEIHPSWLGAANRLKKNFGATRPVTYEGNPFVMIELELSFIEGEIAEVEKLQSNSPSAKAKYRILTNTEAKDFLNGVDVFAGK